MLDKMIDGLSTNPWEGMANAAGFGEEYEAAMDSVYDAVGDAVETAGDIVKSGLDLAEHVEGTIADTARGAIHDTIEDVSHQSTKLGEMLQDTAKTAVLNEAKALGMECAGKLVSKQIDKAADVVRNAGVGFKANVHQEVETMRPQKLLVPQIELLATSLEQIPFERIEEPTIRNGALAIRTMITGAMNYDISAAKYELGRDSVDAVVLGTKSGIAMRSPIPGSDELKIGEQRNASLKLTTDLHDGVGGKISGTVDITTARLEEDRFSLRLTLEMKGSLGIGASAAGEGASVDGGLAESGTMELRGSKEFIDAAKELAKGGMSISEIKALLHSKPDQIRMSASMGTFLSADVAHVLEAEIGTQLQGEFVYDAQAGWNFNPAIEFIASASAGRTFMDTMGDDIPSTQVGLAHTFKLEPSKTGTIKLTMMTKFDIGDETHELVRTTEIDPKSIGVNANALKEMIQNNEFDPKAFDLKFEIKHNKTTRLSGSVFKNGLGEVKNILEKNEVVSEKTVRLSDAKRTIGDFTSRLLS